MTEITRILVTCLAQLDAMYWPLRDYRARYWGAVWALRARYPVSGTPWRGGGDKGKERDLTAAAESGLLDRLRARTKTIGAKLTERGIREAWTATGVHPYSDVIVLDETLRHAPRGNWVPETAFGDGNPWGVISVDELRLVDQCQIAGLITGLVEANCSTKGHVCYRVTGKPRPDVPRGAIEKACPEADPDAVEVYERALKESLAWLDSQTAESVGARGEIGRLPLSTDAMGQALAK